MEEVENLLFSWFEDFWTCPWLPKPRLFISGDTKTLHRIQENLKSPQIEYVCKSKKMKIERFGHVGNTRVEHVRPFNKFFKILNMGSTSSENMKWNVGNIR